MKIATSTAKTHGLGERLRAWRVGNAFDLDAASALLGVSANYLYMIERGVHQASPPLIKRFEDLVVGLSVFHSAEIARRIPILSWVQAGRATCYEEMPVGWLDWLDVLCPDPKAFALRLRGDSMLPKYHAGDMAVVMPSYPPKTLGLAVAKVQDDSATFKTVSFRGRVPARYTLIPLNPTFSPVVVQRDEMRWIYPVHSVVSLSAWN